MMPSRKTLLFVALFSVFLISIIILLANVFSGTFGWRNYRDTQYKYSLKYPKNSTFVKVEDAGTIKIEPKIEGSPKSQKIYISRYDNPNGSTARDYYAKLSATLKADGVKPSDVKFYDTSVDTDSKEFEINGVKVLQITKSYGNDLSLLHHYLTNGKIILDVYYINVDTSNPDTEKFVQIFSTILSTVKFTK